jgi:hypothetical protein
MNLPAAPIDPVGADGQPLFGRYTGVAESFGWPALAAPFGRGALWRRFRHKRWHFVALVTDEVFCGLAVVDIGWSNSAFAYVFDRARREVVAAFSPVGLPGLTASVGHSACAPSRFRLLNQRIDIEPAGPLCYALRLRSGGFRIDAAYGGAAPRLLAVGPARDGGSVHATQKSPALALSGELHAGGQRYCLDGGVASFDYSNGLLGRSTAWRWVSAHTADMGVNLQTGYFGSSENALWLDGRIVPLGEAEFDIEPGGPLAPWRIRTADGLLDLRFTPEGVRRDDKNLVLATSRLTQQVGTFDGWVAAAPGAPPRPVAGLTGLTEDYGATW